MRRLCFGGSFNPVHSAHLICARAVAEVAGFDRVTLIPSGSSPHKQADSNMAEAPHRLEMCRLAIAGDPLFEVDEIEVNRPGPSYTLETVLEMKRRGGENLSWLIGADMAMYLPQWHEPARLLAEVNFVLMARPGWTFDWDQLPIEFRHLEKNVVQTPLIDISSTAIRRRIKAGKSIRYLTSDAVMDYIAHHRLYL